MTNIEQGEPFWLVDLFLVILLRLIMLDNYLNQVLIYVPLGDVTVTVDIELMLQVKPCKAKPLSRSLKYMR